MSEGNEETKPQYKEPSKEFKIAVRTGGGCRIECGFCGRVFFSSEGGWDWDEGELEELKKLSEEQPDKYIDYGYETPTWGSVDGKQAVIDCPCNALRRYEDWIWSHRYMIADYFEARVNSILENAELEQRMVLKRNTEKLKALFTSEQSGSISRIKRT